MKKIKKFLAGIVSLSLLGSTMFALPASASGEISEHWSVSGADDDNYILVTSKYAYEGNNALHVVHSDGTDTALNLLPTWSDSESADLAIRNPNLSDEWARIDVNSTLTFYAKGTLPEAASFQIITTNGRLNASADKASWTVGEPDANGWYKVTIKANQGADYGWNNLFGNLSGNQGFTGLHISGDCDFYADNFTLTVVTSKSWIEHKTLNVLKNFDPGFEAATVTEIVPPEYIEADEFDVEEPENSFITEGSSWTVSYGGTAGTTGNNYISFGNKYAHSGNNSAHIVYTDTANAGNSVNLSANIPITGVNLTDLDILDMSLKFYVKGNLPEGANGGVTMGLTNGFYNFFTNKHLAKDDNTDHAYCKIGKPDANGWQEVEVTLYQSTVYHGKGTIGGNLSNPVITITGPCNFYVDDFSINFNLKNSNWSAKTVLTNLFDDVDTGFEGYFEKPKPQYDDDEEYEPAATRTTLVSDDDLWTVGYGGISGTTGNNYISFSNKYAHTGNNSAHIVYTDEASASNPMVLEAKIPTSSVSLTDCDIAYVTLSFYVKGNLPGANSGVSLGLTNGFYSFFTNKQLCADDNAGSTSFTIGDPDANGWQKVEVKLNESLVYHGKGTIGGNLSNPKIAITGPCNFYADDFSLEFKLLNSGWGQKTLYENVLATCDPSFENYYEGTSDIIVSKFDEVDFGQSQFSITGQNAQVITADIKTLENGLIMASVPVYNEKVSPFGVMYIAALYKDGQLIDASVIKTNINAAEATSINLVTNVQNVDENAKYELKAFLWDNAFEPVTTAAAISNK